MVVMEVWDMTGIWMHEKKRTDKFGLPQFDGDCGES